MSKIRVLPDHISNLIAAGEVVERPASVAKELVENAVDAGATRIVIDVESGGRRLLKITDDGEGMNRDDAVLAFERHATSKISKAEDLNAIGTLGFRGEALASIASVARVELVTCPDDASAATRVVIEGGRMRDVKDAPHPRGTTIAVRDLFFNTPARRKFLRSEATESYHLTNLARPFAWRRRKTYASALIKFSGRSFSTVYWKSTTRSVSLRKRVFLCRRSPRSRALFPLRASVALRAMRNIFSSMDALFAIA